ncbi:MAG TPA: hypothetical protein VI197_03245 [Polyangiaceae bacterium]
MQRTASLVALGLAVSVAACGPSPKPKPATGSIETDGAEPESTEWLYATPESSGELAQDCKLVADALRGEQSCSGALCQHGITLANDWLRLCASIEEARVPEVNQLVAKLEERSKVSGGECAYQGEQLISKGCPAEQDCAVAAQLWATSCASHTSPLVVRMIEKQVSRSTQKPVQLDTTPCATVLAKLTETTSCGNDFECAEKVKGLGEYRARCVDASLPQPLDDALKQALLLLSAKQAPPAILVQEARFPPEKGRLLLDDSSGFVAAVGDQHVPNVNLFIKVLRDSEFVLPIKLARIFAENNRHYLRVGAIDADDPETFFRRFPSLALVGQRAALNGEAANTVIARLNDLVKHLREPKRGFLGIASSSLDPERLQEATLAFLLSALAPAAPLEGDTEFQAELAKADKYLVSIFDRLAASKRARLPKPSVREEAMRERVAFARRAWQHPLLDVTPNGVVALGATNPALFVDIEALLPVSFAAYREGIDGSIGKALRKLEAPLEAELQSQARTRAEACVAKRQELLELERTLLACSFGVESCPAELIENTSTQLDETVNAHTTSRMELAAAVASLDGPAEGKLAQLAASCQP